MSHSGQVSRVEKLFQSFDVSPVGGALSLFTANEIGQRHERDGSAAVHANFATAEDVFEIRKKVVRFPKLEPLFPAVVETTDLEPAERRPTPTVALDEHAGDGKSRRTKPCVKNVP